MGGGGVGVGGTLVAVAVGLGTGTLPAGTAPEGWTGTRTEVLITGGVAAGTDPPLVVGTTGTTTAGSLERGLVGTDATRDVVVAKAVPGG